MRLQATRPNGKMARFEVFQTGSGMSEQFDAEIARRWLQHIHH